MQRAADPGSSWHKAQTALLGLTLITSAVHFTDNALRLDLYPGPAWLTRNVVFAAWPLVLAAAYLAYRIDTRTALIAYALLGFAGLAHYLMPHGMGMPLRCTLTVGAEAIASAGLIACALLRPRAHQPC